MCWRDDGRQGLMKAFALDTALLEGVYESVVGDMATSHVAELPNREACIIKPLRLSCCQTDFLAQGLQEHACSCSLFLLSAPRLHGCLRNDLGAWARKARVSLLELWLVTSFDKIILFIAAGSDDP